MRYKCQTCTNINHSGCKNFLSTFLVAFVRFQFQLDIATYISSQTSSYCNFKAIIRGYNFVELLDPWLDDNVLSSLNSSGKDFWRNKIFGWMVLHFHQHFYWQFLPLENNHQTIPVSVFRCTHGLSPHVSGCCTNKNRDSLLLFPCIGSPTDKNQWFIL